MKTLTQWINEPDLTLTDRLAKTNSSRRATPVDVAIGQRLRRLRKDRNLSQEGVAAKMGISYQMWQRYEAGKSKVGGSRLVQILDILNITTDDLLGGIAPGIGLSIPLRSTPIQAAYDILPPHQQKALLRMAQAMVEDQ